MKYTDEITNTQDAIDSRDIIARIEHLRDELDGLIDAIDADDEEQDQEAAREALADWLGCEVANLPESLADLKDLQKSGFTQSDEAQELANLEAFAEEASGYASDWPLGETLIRDSYFEDYARQLAEDVGAIHSDAKWPCTCIDWKEAADELKQDYSAIEFDGITYWTR